MQLLPLLTDVATKAARICHAAGDPAFDPVNSLQWTTLPGKIRLVDRWQTVMATIAELAKSWQPVARA